MKQKLIKIALIGNANCGKTTVFNYLTGSQQYVGNRAGVTVEKKEAFLKGNKNVIITDLPGIYSLSPYTSEEIVTRDYILDEKPDAILSVADASSLERGIYLASQLTESGIPTVLMLNMIDMAEKRGIVIDTDKLQKALGIEVCTAAASKGRGVFEAAERAVKAASQTALRTPTVFPERIDQALRSIRLIISPYLKKASDRQFAALYAVKLFERDKNIGQRLKLPEEPLRKIEESIKTVEIAEGDISDSIIIGSRYDFAQRTAEKCAVRTAGGESLTEKADKILTGKYTAFPCFALIMTAVYFLSAGPVGAFLSDCLKSFIVKNFTALAEGFLTSVSCAEWLKGLITEGIIGGVGTVVGFLPQLAVLFLMLALLEDIGYMSRVAFISDRFFRKFGLSGKSFIPMIIATGCGVPAIMSSRTVEDPARRRMTIITSTFMPCGAKLPVIAMVSTLFFDGKWWVAPLCYFLGIFSVLLSGLILKKMKIFASAYEPFVMVMPDYHLPMPKNILKTLWERCGSFLKRAGTTILLASAVIWFLSSFGIERGKIAAAANMEDSILKNIGEALSIVFEPLGFGGWQPVVATIMGLLAKEELVGVFGVLSPTETVSVFGSSLSAFSFLVFNLLCAPCIAAVSTIKKEMDSPLWTAFALCYQTAFAYTVSFCIFNLGEFFMGGGFNFLTLMAGAAVTAVVGVILFGKRNKNSF